MELNQLARTIFDDILAQGGRVYIVGGSVRDVILKNSGEHDVDVEVYHMTYEQLHDLLAKYGVVNTFGKMFAIMQLENLKGYDFALPRQEPCALSGRLPGVAFAYGSDQSRSRSYLWNSR